MSHSLPRRWFLRAVAGALASVTAGCSAMSGGGSSPSASGDERAGTDATTDTTTADTTATDDTATAWPPLSESRPSTPAAFAFETPVPSDCEVSERPRPAPTAGIEPKRYPAVPTLSSHGNAESYATDYEAVLQFNAYLATEGNADTRQLDVRVEPVVRLSEAFGDGYLVAVDGELSVLQGNVAADLPVAGLYYVGPDVAFRADIAAPNFSDVESLRAVTAEETSAIYCG